MYVLSFSRPDIKCSPPCWFCKDRCLVCLSPAEQTSRICGEDILHCSDPCLQIMFKNPGIINLLPPNFEVVNSPDQVGCRVVLPEGHSVVVHTCRHYKRKDEKFGQYILMLCVNKKNVDSEPYLLYHQFNALRQITFGFFVSYNSWEFGSPLGPLSEVNQMKCLKFMRQLLVLEPIQETMRDMLAQQGISDFTPNTM